MGELRWFPSWRRQAPSVGAGTAEVALPPPPAPVEVQAISGGRVLRRLIWTPGGGAGTIHLDPPEKLADIGPVTIVVRLADPTEEAPE
jgi:hypothetical protein